MSNSESFYKLEGSASIRYANINQSLCCVELENGNRRFICRGGYFDVPPNTEPVMDAKKHSINGSNNIKYAVPINGKIVVLAKYILSGPNDYKGYVIICNYEMTEMNVITCETEHFQIRNGLIYCFPQRTSNEIKIFDTNGECKLSLHRF